MFAEGVLVGYAARDELREACSRCADWLHPRERDALRRYCDSEAREAWLAGRIVSKQLIQQAVPETCDPRNIEIRSRDRDGRHVRPRIRIAGRPAPWCLSISHSLRSVLAALSLDHHLRVGVDVTPIDDRPAGFLRLWFTEREQERLQTLGPRDIARYWAAKEAVYKALNDGGSFAPRQIEIAPVDDSGARLRGRVGGRGLTAECLVETCVYGGEMGATAVWRWPRPAAPVSTVDALSLETVPVEPLGG